MKSGTYTLGLDFGTESVRCLAVDVNSGEEKAVAVSKYPNGMITNKLPGTSITLNSGWALQNPEDWLNGLRDTRLNFFMLSYHRFFMSLFWSIATGTPIALQFSADC